MKKKFSVLILLSVIALIFSSCCTQVMCLGAFEIEEISLQGFKPSETKEIVISSYKKGSNFQEKIESATVAAETHTSEKLIDSIINNNLMIFTEVDMNPESDYLLEFKDIGVTYKITDITTGKEKCNTCFLKQDYITVLSNYQLNGKFIESGKFEIYK